MNTNWEDLVVRFDKSNPELVLADWRWLVDSSMRLLLISAIGDLFLADKNGLTFRLDANAGKLVSLDIPAAEFIATAQQPQKTRDWLAAEMVGDLIADGKRLGPGQCYSCVVLPILGGEMSLANLEPCDIAVHFGMLGQIHYQVKDLPPGTKITDVQIEGL